MRDNKVHKNQCVDHLAFVCWNIGVIVSHDIIK